MNAGGLDRRGPTLRRRLLPAAFVLLVALGLWWYDGEADRRARAAAETAIGRLVASAGTSGASGGSRDLQRRLRRLDRDRDGVVLSDPALADPLAAALERLEGADAPTVRVGARGVIEAAVPAGVTHEAWIESGGTAVLVLHLVLGRGDAAVIAGFRRIEADGAGAGAVSAGSVPPAGSMRP